VPASHFASPGTTDSDVALLGKAVTIMYAVHVMETTLGSAAHLSPPGMPTCHECLSAQYRYVCFCSQNGHVGSDEALLPANERPLMHVATPSSNSLCHSSIKVYLSAMHIKIFP